MVNCKVKDILIIALMCLSCFITFDISSEEVKTDIENEKIAIEMTVEDANNDLMNRAIFAFFGLDALDWFTPYNISNLDSFKMDSESIEKLVSPFPFIYPKMKYIFYIIINVSIIAFIVYFSWIMYFGLMLSQNSGQFLGESWNTTYMIVKLLVCVAFLAPIGGGEDYTEDSPNTEFSVDILSSLPSISSEYYSVAQAVTFKVAGLSNKYGRDLNEAIIDNQPRIYPSLGIPKSDAKFFEAKKLLDYMICRKSNPRYGNDILFEFEENASSLRGVSKSKSCSVEIGIGLDIVNYNIVKNNEVLKGIIGDFREKQLIVLKNLIINLVKKSDKVASNILSQTLNNTNIVESRFKEYLIGGLKSAENSNWEDHCDEIINYEIRNDNFLNEDEAREYGYMGIKCISYEINKSILLPPVEGVSSSIRNGEKLKERKIELCSLDNSEGAVTLIGDSIDEHNDSSKDLEVTYKFNPIHQCVKDSCGGLESTVGSNLYSCSNSISLYKKMKEQEAMKKYGILTLGANIYTLFTSHSDESSKSSFNNFKINYEDDNGEDFKEIIENESQDSETSKFKINVFKHIEFEDEYEDILDYNYSSVESSKFKNKDIGVKSIIYDIFKMGNSGGILGSERLIKCTVNPLSYVDGYSCGSVPEEYTVFGKGLMSSSTQYFLLEMLVARNAVKYANAKKIAKLKGGEIASNAVKKEILKYSGMLFLSAGLSEILLGNSMTTDDFGSLTSKDVGMLNYSEEALVALHVLLNVNGSSIMKYYLDIIFGGLFYIGVLFAYVIPFYPFFLSTVLFFEWFLLLMTTLIIIPIWAVYIIKPGQGQHSEIFLKGLNILFSMFFKIPFMIIGIVLAWVLTNTVISRIIGLFDFDTIMNINASSSVMGIFDLLVSLIIYVVLIYVVTNIAIGIVSSFYLFATDWIVGGTNSKQKSGSVPIHGANSNVKSHFRGAKQKASGMSKVFGKKT